MSEREEVIALLREIRDNQREALDRQAEQLEIARSQLERSASQVSESIRLQREAVDRFRTVGRLALPAILVCIGLILYLFLRYL